MTGTVNAVMAELQGQHVFTPVSHPELRKLGRKNIQTFLRERERHLLRIKHAKSSVSNIAAISLKSSVYLDLLLSLVELGESEGISDIDSLIEEALKTWLNAKEAIQFDTLTIKELEDAVRASIRMSVNEKDPELRIKALLMDYKTFLRIRRWGHHIPKNLWGIDAA